MPWSRARYPASERDSSEAARALAIAPARRWAWDHGLPVRDER